MESPLAKKIKRFKKSAIVLVAVTLELGAFYYVFFIAKESDTTNVGVVEAIDSQEASYQEYRDYVSNTNKGIKNLLDGAQLKKIEVFDYPDIDLSIPRNDNPFAKSF